jgi:hypothetical protein
MSKFIFALLLFVPVFSTPSLAQQCIADTIASVTADEYFLNSGAVYRELPVDAGDIEFTTVDDYVPYKAKGDLIFTRRSCAAARQRHAKQVRCWRGVQGQVFCRSRRLSAAVSSNN